MESVFINAYVWMFGCSRAEARKAWRNADDERKALVIGAFKDNARKAFSHD